MAKTCENHQWLGDIRTYPLQTKVGRRGKTTYDTCKVCGAKTILTQFEDGSYVFVVIDADDKPLEVIE